MDAYTNKRDLDKISKTMSYILRHAARKERVRMDANGFVAVKDIIALRSLKNVNPTEDRVKWIVSNCPKNRFFLEQRSKGLFVRANQGHSIAQVRVEMETITDPTQVPLAIHGTYYEAWEKIRKTGLKKMGRQHIHLAVGEPQNASVTSGMRNTAQVLIFIDIEKALRDGISILRSENNVILTPGIEGTLPVSYFKNVLDATTRQVLFTNTE